MTNSDVSSFDCISMHVRRAERAIAQHYNNALKPLDLRITQYTVLSYLQASEQATASDLKAFLAADQTTVSRVLRPLVRDGLIAANEGADKRQKILSLTKGGNALYKQAHALWLTAQTELSSLLGEHNKAALLDMSDEIVSKISRR